MRFRALVFSMIAILGLGTNLVYWHTQAPPLVPILAMHHPAATAPTAREEAVASAASPAAQATPEGVGVSNASDLPSLAGISADEITALVDQRMQADLASTSLQGVPGPKGDKGDPGPQGPAGLSGAGTPFVIAAQDPQLGGTVGSFKYLSSQSISADTLALSAGLTAGSVTADSGSFSVLSAGAATTTNLAVTTLPSCNTVGTDQAGNFACGLGTNSSPWNSIFNNTALTPTSSSVGIFVTASSTIAADFRVDGNATTTKNFTVGTNTLVVQTDTGNVGIGTTAPQAALDVNGNINIGYTNAYEIGESPVLRIDTGGSYSGTYVGFGAGKSMVENGSSSYSNTFVGFNSGYSDTVGYSNTFIGVQAGYSNQANANTFVGRQAGKDLITGSGNVFLGYQTGTGIDNVGNLTLLGTGANAVGSSLSNSTAIGVSAIVTASNQIVLGNGSVTQTLLHGNVGIGDIYPTAMLTASSSAATVVTASLAGASSQTANLLNLTNNNGAFLSGFTASGGLLMNISSTTAVNIQNGSGVTKFVIDSNTGNATTSGNLTLTLASPFIQWAPAVGTDRLSLQSGTTTLASLDIGGSWKTKGPQSANASPDYAETIAASPDVGAGDVVVADATATERVTKAEHAYQDGILGVVSSGPGFLIRSLNRGSLDEETIGVPLALAGRVPVKISDENGPVMVGDPLTSSATLPGYAMKATKVGQIIGYALSNFDGSQSSGGTTIPTITVFLKPGFWEGPAEGDGSIFAGILDQLSNLGIRIEQGILTVKKFVADKITAGRIDAGELHADKLCAGDVCVTPDQLQQLLNNAGSAPTAPVIEPAAPSDPAPTRTAVQSPTLDTTPTSTPAAVAN